MDSETRTLKNLIAAWEKKARHAERTLTHLKAALAVHEKTIATEAQPGRRRGRPRKVVPTAVPAPFARKYQKTAKEYILELLSVGRPMAVREIRTMLAGRGLHYSEQALALSMKSLENAGRIRKQRAPNGSAAHYVFELVKQNSEDAAL